MNANQPIAYMKRTRRYYQALGYGAPYRWACFEDVPFTKLQKPVSNARIGLVTTAALFNPSLGDQGPGAAYNGSAKFYDVYTHAVTDTPDVRISHIAYDRAHTRADDMHSWFPLAALKRAHEVAQTGSISERFYGLPTNRSHKITEETDCPKLVQLMLEDKVDAAIIVPNCPVCHQSSAFAANQLERAGIATVIMGCALDIIEYAGVPRFVFSDFPLGNSAGRPHDVPSQDKTLALALDLLTNAPSARTTTRSPLVWSTDATWKDDYSNPDKLDPEELARRRADFDTQKNAAKKARI